MKKSFTGELDRDFHPHKGAHLCMLAYVCIHIQVYIGKLSHHLAYSSDTTYRFGYITDLTAQW